jgi:hypothetical protein
LPVSLENNFVHACGNTVLIWMLTLNEHLNRSIVRFGLTSIYRSYVL